jgi:predicted RNA methylase
MVMFLGYLAGSRQERPSTSSENETIAKICTRSPVSEDEVDSLFPEEVRKLSVIHWTPFATAARAAELCVGKDGDRILDVGSGSGKFCIIGALTTAGSFFGVEQRASLVKCSREVVTRFWIPRAQFITKNMVDLDWSSFDAIYLFNPFWENIDPSIRIDDMCELSSELFTTYVSATRKKLATLKTGTRVVILNGFGGELPPSYQMVHAEDVGYLVLQVWEKI